MGSGSNSTIDVSLSGLMQLDPHLLPKKGGKARLGAFPQRSSFANLPFQMD